MKKFLRIGILMLLICSLFTGCGKKFYTEEELYELHDVISYVQNEEAGGIHASSGSLTTAIGEKATTDFDFIDYLSTRDIDPNKPMIALTFDDGPRNASTNKVLDVLQANNARATFFVVGSNIGDNTADTLKRMTSMGCEIGNHTTDHSWLTELDPEGIMSKIDPNNEAIKQYSGQTCRLVRPPGGLINDTVQATVPFPLINWTVDTRDWESRDASKVIPIAESGAADGAIVLMHDIYDSTATAVETIVPYLVQQGYQLVTVSELAYMKGIKLEAGQKYLDIGMED